MVTLSCRLNPFEFRAGIWIEARIYKKQLQSLNPFEFRAGIWIARYAPSNGRIGLNPFEFRAGIWMFDRHGAEFATSVLIPLNSGLVFELRKKLASTSVVGLNPFEFRAGIWIPVGNMLASAEGLNPFEFRAGIWMSYGTTFGTAGNVLIPLNSGLVFELLTETCLILSVSLNPFEFRAGIWIEKPHVIWSNS